MLQKTKDLPKILKNAFICLFIAALLTLGAAAAEALVIDGSVLSSIDVGKTYQATVKDLRIDEKMSDIKAAIRALSRSERKTAKLRR